MGRHLCVTLYSLYLFSLPHAYHMQEADHAALCGLPATIACALLPFLLLCVSLLHLCLCRRMPWPAHVSVLRHSSSSVFSCCLRYIGCSLILLLNIYRTGQDSPSHSAINTILLAVTCHLFSFEPGSAFSISSCLHFVPAVVETSSV